MRLERVLQVIGRAAAWEWMVREYLGGVPSCPACRAEITGERARRAFDQVGQVYCAGCGKRFAASAGTPIHETSWRPEEYLQCLALHLAGTPRTDIAAHLGKSTHAVRDMLERIQLRHAACAPVAPVHHLASSPDQG